MRFYLYFLFCFIYALQHTSVYWASAMGNIEYLNEAFSSNKINVSWCLLSYSHLLTRYIEKKSIPIIAL